jgi:hypothetical protein
MSKRSSKKRALVSRAPTRTLTGLHDQINETISHARGIRLAAMGAVCGSLSSAGALLCLIDQHIRLLELASGTAIILRGRK